MPLRLALSLHAADEALRSELMPVNERYPLSDVIDACRAFYERKRRRVFVEYVMLAGVNDRYEQALALARLLEPRRSGEHPHMFKVNLIPYNPTDSVYDGSSRESIAAFKGALESRGVPATVRLTRGRDIDAACGQLAAACLSAAEARRRCSPASPAETVVELVARTATEALAGAAAGAGLAGAQQSIAQLGLLLGARVPLPDVGQLVQRAQAEQLEELCGRAVHDRAELGASGLLHQSALQQRGRGRVGAHATNAGDLRARDRLQIGDDRKRLGLRGRQHRGARDG